MGVWKWEHPIESGRVWILWKQNLYIGFPTTKEINGKFQFLYDIVKSNMTPVQQDSSGAN
jgi:hypothetical protein